jgi:hypothetical protein
MNELVLHTQGSLDHQCLMESCLLDYLYVKDGIDAFIFRTLICWTDHYPTITGAD